MQFPVKTLDVYVDYGFHLSFPGKYNVKWGQSYVSVQEKNISV